MTIGPTDYKFGAINGPSSVAAPTTTAAPEGKVLSPAQSLPKAAQVRQEQTSKPLLSPEATKFIQKACGFSLMMAGGAGLVVLSPIALPLGIVITGASYATVKGFDKIAGNGKDNSLKALFTGATIGTLGCAGLIVGGYMLATRSNHKAETNIESRPENKSESRTETAGNSRSRAESGTEGRTESGTESGTGSWRESLSIGRSRSGSKSGNESTAESSGAENTGPKLELNTLETKFAKRMSDFRGMSKDGLNSQSEITERKDKLSGELKLALGSKEISKEFYKQALGELQKFDGDFTIGQNTLKENADKAFTFMMEKNDLSIEFFTFINDIPKNSEEMRTKLPDTTQTITEIKDLQVKAQKTMADETLTSAAKQSSVFSDRGHLRIDAQSFLLSDLKKMLSEGKTEVEKSEIVKSIDVIKRHLSHELEAGKVHPSSTEVKDAYQTLRAAAEGSSTATTANQNIISEYQGFIDKDKATLKDYSRQLNNLEKNGGSLNDFKTLGDKMQKINANIRSYQSEINKIQNSIDEAHV